MNTKYFLTVLFHVIAIKALGQFTLLAATHAPTVGTVYYSSYDSSLMSLPQQDGPNCLWNFSFINLLEKNKFVTTSQLPGPGVDTEFPLVTLEQFNPTEKFKQSYYFHSSSSVFELLGTWSDTGPFVSSDPLTIYKWPLNYGDTFSDISLAEIPGIFVNSGKEFTTMSGYGTLVLPNGVVYSNVMKMRKVNNTVNTAYNLPGSVSLPNNSITDLYFDANLRYPVLLFSKNYSEDVNGNKYASYNMQVLEPYTVGLTELTRQTGVEIYPNPSGSNFSIVNSEIDKNDNSAFIYSSEGRLIKELKLNSTITNIQVDNLSSGIYLVVVQSGDNRITKKLVVVK